jgi:hypothetical protein
MLARPDACRAGQGEQPYRPRAQPPTCASATWCAAIYSCATCFAHRMSGLPVGVRSIAGTRRSRLGTL